MPIPPMCACPTSPVAAARRAWVRRFAAWLTVLALGLQVFAPVVCLARQLSDAPLGSICTAGPAGDAPAGVPVPDGGTGLHGPQHCGHCTLPGVYVAMSVAAALPPARWTEPPRPLADAAPPTPAAGWRPPPRGPPSAA